MCLLALPWLSPYTSGPTPNAWPWLLSAFCAIVLWLFWRSLNPELIATSWVLVAAISAAIGLVQYFGLASALGPWVSQTIPGEAFANLRQRNQFATLTSIGLVALIGLLSGRPAEYRVPGWAGMAMVLLALGNATSGSRTGLLQWVAVLLLMCVLRFRRKLVVFAFQSVLVYFVAVLTLPWLMAAVTGLDNEGLFGRLVQVPTCGSRMVLWANVLTLIGQKPWLGWGWGELDYAHFITPYAGMRFCEILDNAHNLPLQLAVELGVPAALAICLGLAWMVFRGRPWRETNPVRQTAWGVLTVIAIHSMLEYPLWYGPFQIAVGLCVGLLWTRSGSGHAASSASPDNSQQKAGVGKRWTEVHPVKVVVAVVGIALLGYAGASYYRVSQIYLPPSERSEAYRDDTLNKIRSTWLFRDQARFAELSITELKPENAVSIHSTAIELLHYSPEPRVIEKLIESAVMLGLDDEARECLSQYRAAFPEEYNRWTKNQADESQRLSFIAVAGVPVGLCQAAW